MKKICCFFLLVCVVQNSVYSQTLAVDRLKLSLQTEKRDSTRCLLLEQLGYQYQGARPDSALIFAQEGLDLARRINFLKGEVKCLSRLGTISAFLFPFSF